LSRLFDTLYSLAAAVLNPMQCAEQTHRLVDGRLLELC